METKKLSDVNAVAQISDNDFITCIMSNGEVAKIKKSDLLPLVSSAVNGLMSSSDKIKLDGFYGNDFIINNQFKKITDKTVFSGYNYGTSAYLLLTECLTNTGFSGCVSGLHNSDTASYGNNLNITLSYNYGETINLNKHSGQRNQSSRLAYQGVVKITYNNKQYIALKFTGGTGALTAFVNAYTSKIGESIAFTSGASCSNEEMICAATTNI